jgi:DNA-binding Xre family transcriptional regulator
MRYKDNEQLKEYIRLIMRHENITYKELGEKIGTSQQNVYKMLNKNQLKFDDVLKVCNALEYKFSINIVKENGEGVESEPYIQALSAMDGLEDMRMELAKMKESYEKVLEQIEEINNQKDDKNKKY